MVKNGAWATVERNCCRVNGIAIPETAKAHFDNRESNTDSTSIAGWLKRALTAGEFTICDGERETVGIEDGCKAFGDAAIRDLG
jgi:hypothetical protein